MLGALSYENTGLLEEFSKRGTVPIRLRVVMVRGKKVIGFIDRSSWKYVKSPHEIQLGVAFDQVNFGGAFASHVSEKDNTGGASISCHCIFFLTEMTPLGDENRLGRFEFLHNCDISLKEPMIRNCGD